MSQRLISRILHRIPISGRRRRDNRSVINERPFLWTVEIIHSISSEKQFSQRGAGNSLEISRPDSRDHTGWASIYAEQTMVHATDVAGRL